jgi:hypothetical protein
MSLLVMPGREAVAEPQPEEMRHYAAFGGVLRSAVRFPELVPAESGAVDWTLRIGSTPPGGSMSAIGERRVREEIYRVFRTSTGLRLEYSHAGLFDVAGDGSEITWYPCPGASDDLMRTIVLGPILALVLELSGHFCLHGSAVEVASRGVAFVGAKHHGKSTLGVALTRAGARFLGDDTLAVTPGPPAVLRPGIGSVRLWDDAARALRVAELCETVFAGVKTTATGFAGTAIRRSAVPLDTVYVLEPIVCEATSSPVQRVRIDGIAAAVSLAHHAKLPDPLVGYVAAGSRLRTAVSIAATVPVYSLRIARSFELLPLVVGQILDWHGGGLEQKVAGF